MDGQFERHVPARLEQLRHDIIANQASLPRRLKQIAQFAIDHPDQMALSTLSELSHVTNAPASAFVRFAKSFGFSGFKEIQDVFQSSVRDNFLSYEKRIVNMGNAEDDDLLGAITSAGINSLIALRDTINRDDVRNAVEQIVSADTVYLCASGRSRTMLTYLEYLLTRIGVRNKALALAENDAEAELSLVSKNDVVLAISFVPYRALTKMVVNIAEERDIPLICITDNDNSPIHKGTCFLIDEKDIGGFRFVSSTVIFAQYLALEVARKTMLPATGK